MYEMIHVFNTKINSINKLEPSKILLLILIFLLISIRSWAQPNATASSNSPVCTGSTINLTGGPNSMLSYLWTGPNGFTAGTQNASIPNASSLNAGVYTLTVMDLTGTDFANTTVVVTALPTASISYSGSSFCKTVSSQQPVSLSGTGAYTGGTFAALPVGLTINGISGAITPSTSTANNYTVTYTVPASGGCPSVPASTPVTITALPVATFSYSSSPYCSNESDPLPAFTVGAEAGTFSSSPFGLSFVSTATGQVDLSASTPGSYSVTNTIPAAGGCSAVVYSSPITITSLPTASISYSGNPFCKSVSTHEPVTLSGTGTYTGGIFTSSPSGLTINPSTGAVTPSTSTAGTYTVTYTIPLTGGCPAFPVTTSVVITSLPVATFAYTTTPYCSSEANPLPTFSGGGEAGTFSSSPSGLVFVSTATGQVNLTASTPGSYTVTNTIAAAGGCGVVFATSPITITALPVAAFAYTTTPYCSSESNPLPTFNPGGVAGTFTSTAGLVFVSPSTGQVNLLSSTPGAYSVTNTIPAAGGCALVTASSPITITLMPTATIVYSGSSWCNNADIQNVTLIGTTGGVFSSLQAGLSINPSTGAITPSTSTAGNYTVLYTIAASGGCISFSTSTSVTITSIPPAPVVGAITQPTCALATGSVALSGLPATGIWILTRNPGGITTSGTGTSTLLSLIPAGSYTYTVTNSLGCISPASGAVVINPQPASPAVPVQSVDCSLSFGHAKVTITSPTGAGLEYNLNGGTYQVSPVFPELINNSYLATVRNAEGCITFGTPFSVSCGCNNPPLVAFSSASGNTCGTAAVTVTGNTFSGTATLVTLTSNGAGTLVPSSSIVSPFSFTYTPAVADGGKIIIITGTTNNPLGPPCAAGVSTYNLTVNAIPSAPIIGTINNLTCTQSTGSVVLNGLPSTGTWTLIRNPGSIITNGSGTSTTVSGLVSGTYTFIVTSSAGCTSLASADAVINPQPSAPSAPVVGAITQPTCAISTGSVAFSGLPATGTWTLTRTPGNVTISGSGPTYVVSAIPSGTYTFTVTTSVGCISLPSGNVVINTQPPIPAAPLIGAILPPTCTLSTGSVTLTGLPSSGSWTVIRYPGTISTNGSGTSTTIPGLSSGTYNFTVTTADGCLSGPSLNLVMPAQPSTPSAPLVGTITQPTLAVPTGSVVLNGLPSSGTWDLTRLPGGTITPGSGITKTIAGLSGGVFTFTVKNSLGCTSAESAQVIISTPGVPDLIITNPPAVCTPSTVDLTNPAITTGSTPGLTYSFWQDAGATLAYDTPYAATDGTYYIKGTTVSGYFKIMPVIVVIQQLPIVNGGADQTLDFLFNTTLDATLGNNETGIWSLYSGTGDFTDSSNPKTDVSKLSEGNNILLWTVQSGVCPAVIDTVTIIVHKLVIPTLITPNLDGRNDYFVIKGLPTLGKTELVIFDRRGAQVYKNLNYNNMWDGVDYNGHSLPDDTYFFVLKPANWKSISGYIVIRR